jgi:hypothetical protein
VIVRARVAILAVLIAGPARADRPSPAGATMAAQAWMNAAAKTPPSLDDAVALTGVPFWYEGAVYPDRAARKACAKVGARGTVADARQLAPVLDCLRRGTAPLLEDDAAWTAIELDALPRPLARYRGKLAPLATTHTPVLAHASRGAHEDWAVIAVRADAAAGAAFVDAYAAAHR